MVPFVDDDDAPWWSRLSPAELAELEAPDPAEPAEVLVPEMPAELAEQPHTADRVDLHALVPCECGCCSPPDADEVLDWVPAATREHVRDTELAFTFARQWTLAQQHTAAAWQAAALLHARAVSARGTAGAEHVGSDLALLMNVHPRSGQRLMLTAVQACELVPELVALVASGQLGVRHVEALLAEAARWTDDPEQAARVIRQTLDGCAARLARYGWPTPAELRKRLAKVAILADLQALTTAKRKVAEARGVSLFQTGIGKACLSLEGPELMMLQAYRAIEARAHAMGRLPGDQRSLQQRLHDAATELLCLDADGGTSAVPTTGPHGEPVTITVRGVQIVVLVPYSVLEGGDLELAEIDGYGPLLPSTARELADQAESFRRVAINADTGHLITVDDATPTHRGTPTPTTPQPAPAPEPAATPEPAELDDRADPDAHEPSDPPGDEPDDGPHDEGPDDGPDDDGPGGGPWGGGGPDQSPPTPPPAPGPDQDPFDDPLDTAGVDITRSSSRTSRPASEAPAARLQTTVLQTTVEAAGVPDGALSPETLNLLRRLVAQRVHIPDLSTDRYRVPGRLRRRLIYRDRNVA